MTESITFPHIWEVIENTVYSYSNSILNSASFWLICSILLHSMLLAFVCSLSPFLLLSSSFLFSVGSAFWCMVDHRHIMSDTCITIGYRSMAELGYCDLYSPFGIHICFFLVMSIAATQLILEISTFTYKCM